MRIGTGTYYLINAGTEFDGEFGSPDDDEFKKFARRSGYKNSYSVTHEVVLTPEDVATPFGSANRLFDVTYPGSCPRGSSPCGDSVRHHDLEAQRECL